MCLYPKKIRNKKYLPNEKNGGNVPEPPKKGYLFDNEEMPIYDDRVFEVEVPCGQCIECRQKKAREWQVRLAEEIKCHKYNYFVTLTFSPKELEQICKKTRLKECNAVAGYAVRHMLERWRKTYKTSLKHWLITELGHEGTERIHLHGILFTDELLEFSDMDENNLRVWNYWKYGAIYVGDYVNQKTINYISKYITKIDNDHKGFIGQILASPGIGREFIDKLKRNGSRTYEYRPKIATDFYRLENGSKVKLPTYYRKKLYTDDQREEMWRDFMDLETISILGNDHSTRTCKTIAKIRENGQSYNKELGYGDDTNEWRKKEYNITRRMLQQVEREKQQLIMLEALMKKGIATIEQGKKYAKLKEKFEKMQKKD